MKFEIEVNTSKFQNEIQKAHLNVLFSGAWVKNRVSEKLKPFGLTNEQFNVLRIVRGSKSRPIRAKDISQRMVDPSSNITRIIDKLEHKKLIMREPSHRDRREFFIVLTQDGFDLLEQIDLYWQKENPHTSQSLTTAECILLNELLDKMREG